MLLLVVSNNAAAQLKQDLHVKDLDHILQNIRIDEVLSSLISVITAYLQLLSVESKLFVQNFQELSLKFRKLVGELVQERLCLLLVRGDLSRVKVV